MDDMRRNLKRIPTDWERKTADCKPPLLGGTLARYEQLPVSGRDACVRDLDSSVENRRVERQPGFWPSLPDPVDRLRARAEKRDPLRLLGMQRARQPADAQLLCDLPARFRRRFEHGDAVADLFAESLFPLHPPRASTSGKRAAPAGVDRRLYVPSAVA